MPLVQRAYLAPIAADRIVPLGDLRRRACVDGGARHALAPGLGGRERLSPEFTGLGCSSSWCATCSKRTSLGRAGWQPKSLASPGTRLDVGVCPIFAHFRPKEMAPLLASARLTRRASARAERALGMGAASGKPERAHETLCCLRSLAPCPRKLRQNLSQRIQESVRHQHALLTSLVGDWPTACRDPLERGLQSCHSASSNQKWLSIKG